MMGRAGLLLLCCVLGSCGSRSTRTDGDDGIGEGDSDADADVECGEARWRIETVEEGAVGERFEIAVDEVGFPSIAYTHGELVWARRDETGWSYETVETEVGVGDDGLSLALTAESAPMVAVLSRTESGASNDFSHYVRAIDGQWRWFGHGSEQTASDLSHVVDSQGALRGVFVDGFSAIEQCNNAEEPMSTSMSFSSILHGGPGPGIAVDSSARAHVSLGEMEGALLHAVTRPFGRPSEPTWDFETIGDSADRVGTSIAIDDLDVVHIAWVSGGALMYSTNASGDWATETAAPGRVSSMGVSLDISDDGAARIAYLGANDVRIVSNDTGAWTDESIARAATPGRVSLDTWGADGVHVAFIDSHGLRHAEACVPGAR